MSQVLAQSTVSHSLASAVAGSALAQLTAVQSYLLREKRQVFLPSSVPSTGPSSDKASSVGHLVLAVQTELAAYGFSLDGGLVARLQGMSAEELTAVRESLLAVVREAVGAHVRHQPLFKRFPDNVPQDMDYFVRRLLGYVTTALGLYETESGRYRVLSCGHAVDSKLFNLDEFNACPVCQCQVPELGAVADQGDVAARPTLSELTPLKLLSLATEEGVWTAAVNLASSRTSLSASQKEFLGAVAAAEPVQFLARLPQELAFKENAMFVLARLLKAGCTDPVVFRYVRTATDVLRAAVALCDGDVSLKETTRFKLSNAHRRFLMQAFEALPHTADNLLEDMLRYRGRWLRLGEVLHVGQFARQCPKMAHCFDVLRNHCGDITTYAARVEHLFNSQALLGEQASNELLWLLTQRPGEFARKLDALLQRGLPLDKVLPAFESVVDKVSTTILLTLLTHVRGRSTPSALRAFMPKGSVSKMYVEESDSRVPLSAQACQAMERVVRAALLRRFAEREALGKVYVAPELARVVVPFSQRSASSALTPMTRGSRLPFDASKGFLRLFLNWKEPSDNSDYIDVDLSCGIYDDEWSLLSHLSWTSLHGAGRSVHSGDVRSAGGPDGASEFIDLDLAALRKRGARYASVYVFSWSGQSFNTFPCFAGFMEREEPGRGEPFEAKTVQQKYAVSGDRRVMVPMFVDLQTNEVVWADMGMSGRSYGGACVENSSKRTVQQHRAVLAMSDNRMCLHELFELHAQARGELVSSAEEADLVLDARKLFELDDVMANWL